MTCFILLFAVAALAESVPNVGDSVKALRLLSEYGMSADGNVWNRYVNQTGIEKWRASNAPAVFMADAGHGYDRLVRIHNAPMLNPALPRRTIRDSSGRLWAEVIKNNGSKAFVRYSSLGNTVLPLNDPALKAFTRSGDVGAAAYTRSTAGWYANSGGLLVSASTNVPRAPNFINISTASGWQWQGKGLLLGGNRTNLCVRSAELNLTWQGSATVDIDAATAPDGSQSAERLNITSTTYSRYQQVSLDPNGRTFTFSIWLWADTPHTAQLLMRNSANNESVTSNVFVSNVKRRYSLTKAFAQAGSAWILGGIYPDINATKYPVYAWGGQLEEAQFESSYIPTTTTSVARGADSCSLPVAGNVAAAQGSVYCEATLHGNQSGTANTRDILATTATDKLLFIDGVNLKAFDGTNSATLGYAYVPDKTYRLAVTWGGGVMNIYNLTDGTSATGVTYAGTFGTGGASLKIGENLFGSMKKLEFFDHPLTQAELSAL